MLSQIPVKQIAAIHDLSGFGRTSLSAVIPILSAMGIKVCPLPTAGYFNIYPGKGNSIYDI